MPSIQKIKASDGSANASVATVQNLRSPGASTIIVDTVAGINTTGFMASMGTPHTFIDPVTSEEITVISEATCVDFAGHVDSGHLEIDTVAPGYADGGSAVGDIVIIRPTTQYADNLAATLAVSHADDGTIRATSPKIITGINDTNGNELLKLTATGAAVNELTLANAAAGNGPTLSATGGDTDVSINFAPKGAGKLRGVVNNLFNPYKFHVYRNSAMNTTTTTPTIIPYDTKVFDTGTNIDVVTNKGRFTAPIAGFYFFVAGYKATVTGNSNLNTIRLYKNGSLVLMGSRLVNNGTNNTLGPTVSGLLQLAANDYVEVYSENDGTYAVTVGDSAQTFFQGFLMSAL